MFDDLLEPELLYSRVLKEKHSKNVSEYFENLVKNSGIDIKQNKKTCDSYYESKYRLDSLYHSETNLKVMEILFGILCILIVGIFLLIFVWEPRKEQLSVEIKREKSLHDSLLEKARSETECLNKLFDSSISRKLLEITLPLLKFDRILEEKKFEILEEKFGFSRNENEDESILDIQAGSILGNPFLFFKTKRMTMVEHRYEGELDISYWVEDDEDGGGHTEYETLTASIYKPMPTYSIETHLVYFNEAANQLKFSRCPTRFGTLSEKERYKFLVANDEKLQKMAARSISKGKTFTPLCNTEFEAYFGAFDRDNEVQFRLLFTPLAQKSMLQLFKSKDGYGDDFTFIKNKCMNTIISEHAQDVNIFLDSNSFKDFDYRSIRDKFINSNNECFKSIFFDFAPLFAILYISIIKAMNIFIKVKPDQIFVVLSTKLLQIGIIMMYFYLVTEKQM